MQLESLFSEVIVPFAACAERFGMQRREALSACLAQFGRMQRQAVTALSGAVSLCVTFADLAHGKAYEGLDLDSFQRWHDTFLRDSAMNRLDGHNFCLFSMLIDCGVRISETAQSRLLAGWLDPRGSHGQGSLFLSLFLEELGIAVPNSGEWHIGTEENHVDLLLRRLSPPSVVVVENKSNWAADQPNQLYRYWYSAIYRFSREHSSRFYEACSDRFRLVYLVPNGCKQCSPQSLCKPARKDWTGDAAHYDLLPERIPMRVDVRTFCDFVSSWALRCAEILPAQNHRLRETMRMYAMMCKTM